MFRLQKARERSGVESSNCKLRQVRFGMLSCNSVTVHLSSTFQNVYFVIHLFVLVLWFVCLLSSTPFAFALNDLTQELFV